MFMVDRHRRYSFYQGETGIIKGFIDREGNIEIYIDSWDRTHNFDQDVLKNLRVVSGDEAAQLKAKVPRKGSKVVFHTASADGKIQPGYTGTIKYFDSDGNPQIHIDIRGEVLNCARSILQKLKIDVELEEKRREEKRKEEERRVAAERAAESQRQQVIINCTL